MFTLSQSVEHRFPRVPAIRAALQAMPGYPVAPRSVLETTVSLASNENHHPPLPGVLEAATEAARSMNRYPDTPGAALRERLAEHVGVSAGQVLLGAGSLGVLQHLVASICEAGDEVVFAWRSFEAYPLLVRLAGAVPVAVPLREDESHDLDAMAAAIGPRTRIVLLCSPNNPTGVGFDADALTRFLEGVPSNVLVVLDEAYSEFVTRTDAPDGVELMRRFPNLCVVRTFSKAYGLAGLRIGYALAETRLADDLRRSAPPFTVSSIAQAAAIASLDARTALASRVADVVAERTRLERTIRTLGLVVPSAETNFVWLRCPDDEREALTGRFADAGLIVRGYPGNGVRISIADAATNDRVVEVLAEWTAHR